MSTYFEKITTPWPKGRVGGGGWVNPYGQPDRKKTEIVWPWKSILDDASCPDFFAAQSRSNNLIKDFGKYIVEMVGSIKFWERASAHRNQTKPNQTTSNLFFHCEFRADIFIYQSLLILHIDAIALCWFARLNPGSVPTVRLCGWNVGGWVCAEVGTSSASTRTKPKLKYCS